MQFELIRLPDSLLPAYRERQTERLTMNLRVSLAAGVAIALLFLPWSRWHDRTDQLPTVEIGLALAAGLLLHLGVSFVKPTRTRIELITLSACLFTLTQVSVLLITLPNGFLYGVGTLLSYTVVSTILSIDLTTPIVMVVAVAYLAIPNAALLLDDAPFLILMNTNWLLWSGGLVAVGLAFLVDQSHRKGFLLEYELAEEKARGDALLASLLPAKIARSLQSSDGILADIQPVATVLFADLVGFTQLTRTLSPEELIKLLTGIFIRLDELASTYGVEKIKTIGDAYMAAVGVADAEGRGVDDAAAFSLAAVDAARNYVTSTDVRLDLRVGIATGPVVCGVIGRRRPYFDLWGTTVNRASRLQVSAEPGCVQLDGTTARYLSDRYIVEHRGDTQLVGLGNVETWVILGRHPLQESEADLNRPAIPATGELLDQSRSIGMSGSLPHSDIEPS